MYAVGLKRVVNLRNGDMFLSSSFLPLVLPNRGIGASLNLGWVTNLDKSDIKDYQGNRITAEILSNKVISGTAVGVSGCYYACVGYG